MREIKFRAYIKEFNKTFDVLQLHKKFPAEDFYRVFIDKPIEEGEVKNYRIDGVDNHLMQYTGLKDKNGVEIYEGYILKNPWKENSFGIVEYIDGGITYNLGYMESEITQAEESEVIGNIYESQELLF